MRIRLLVALCILMITSHVGSSGIGAANLASMEFQATPVTEDSPSDAQFEPGAPCWPAGAELEPVDGAPQWSEPPAMVIDPAMSYYATIVTDEGEILIELLVDEAPMAVNNFVCLASAGFYDGTSFHRLFNEHFIQGGDPTGTSAGGPGYTFAEELPDGYAAGDVAMANNAPDANGSQFFIAVSDLTDLIPHDYPVFGRVTSGLEVAEAISQGEVEPDNRGERSRAVDPVTITTITIQELAPRIGPPDPARGVESADDQPSDEEGEIVIEALESSFSVDEIAIPADTDVTVTVVNRGDQTRYFTIDELEIIERIEPGDQQNIVINAPSGTYEYYTSTALTREAGMNGVLIVGDGVADEVIDEPDETPVAEEAAEPVVTAQDFAFEPEELSLEPLKPQTVTIINEGAAPHNFSIDELSISVDVAPGETGTALVIAPSGEYEFYCNVPGHREAGQVGTLIVGGGASGSANGTDQTESGAIGCEGLEDYQEAYDDAAATAVFSHPEAMPLVLELENLDFEQAEDLLTPDEWLILAALFESVSVELDAVEPPAFAADWHQNQVEGFGLLGDMLQAAGDGGFTLAALTYATEIMRIEAEFNTAIEEASAICPEFRAWALETGLDLG